jgi:type II secretory pathway pseudopilin PulG
MKLIQSFVVAAVVAAVLAVPVVSFAQSNAPITRAEVRAQLIQLEQAGYNPASDQTQYPKNIEAAQARVNAENGMSATSYGSSTNGTSASISRAPESDVIGLGPIYARP